ncbi:hypothetical protein DERF_014988 [Dermatophagoides farinae]|uniref:Uncharacterized protein n=1 Tax=Dermatophagoides farinae TaxID=6954 RepID=A0A922L1S8_DERFA|nr:hypothetical protein DERF_014988 [Dermatophagoides farinae]
MESESGIRLQNDLQFCEKKTKTNFLYYIQQVHHKSSSTMNRIIQHDDIKNKQTEKNESIDI